MENRLKLALKIFGVIVGISFFSFMVNIFVGMDDPSIVTTSNGTEVAYSSLSTLVGCLSGVVMTVLLVLMLYYTCWKQGANDKNLLPLQNKKQNKLDGLYSGLTVFVLLVVFVSVALITKSSVLEGISRIFIVAPIIFWYVKMYLCGKFWIAYLYLAALPIITAVGYSLGCKNYSIHKLLVYKNGYKQEDYAETTPTLDYLNDTNKKNLK